MFQQPSRRNRVGLSLVFESEFFEQFVEFRIPVISDKRLVLSLIRRITLYLNIVHSAVFQSPEISVYSAVVVTVEINPVFNRRTMRYTQSYLVEFYLLS